VTERGAERHYSPLDPRRAAVRLVLGLLVGFATGFVLSENHGLAVRIVAGWDAGAISLLTLAWTLILRSDASSTRRRAASEDPGRAVASVLVVAASTFSVFAGTVVMRHARSIEPHRSTLLVALCLVAVASAWTLTHTSYTLRYAHLHYREGHESRGGLTFPGDSPPDDFDLAYFAFTIGMCFQVSDVTISSRHIRRAVLGHAVLSFAYNTVIFALVINLLVGLLS
jgi:uncharacterized membrane protein